MKVMAIVKATKESEDGEMPSTELLADMTKFNEELVAAGVMLAGEGLHPSSKGKRIEFNDKQRVVTDGPFAETKELIAGYWIWNVESMDDALAWIEQSPFQDGQVELRPVFSAEDFGEEFTPELREKEEKLYFDSAMLNSNIQPYLFFGGHCEEALEFYKEKLSAKVEMLMRFNESPDPLPDGMLQGGFENKVMHACFSIGSVRLMASDGCNDASGFDGFRLALTVPAVDDAHRVFDALAEGGTADMPLSKTFWSPCYGQVTDKFGVGWMVMVPGEGA